MKDMLWMPAETGIATRVGFNIGESRVTRGSSRGAVADNYWCVLRPEGYAAQACRVTPSLSRLPVVDLRYPQLFR